MHLVTSTIFFSSTAVYLTPQSTTILLRSFLTASITWWTARGRQILPVREFYAATSSLSHPRDVLHYSSPGTLDDALAPNPCLPIVQTTLAHPNEHLRNIQRALAHFATLYGSKPAGYFSAFKSVAAEGKEAVLD